MSNLIRVGFRAGLIYVHLYVMQFYYPDQIFLSQSCAKLQVKESQAITLKAR